MTACMLGLRPDLDWPGGMIVGLVLVALMFVAELLA